MNKICDIDTLVIASVSKTRIPGLTKELIERRFYFTRVDSSGGFLQGSTNTLLIGIEKERLNELKELLRKYCRRKITRVPTEAQIEAFAQYNQPIIVEAQTGGATVHSIPIEHFEQF